MKGQVRARALARMRKIGTSRYAHGRCGKPGSDRICVICEQPVESDQRWTVVENCKVHASCAQEED